MGSAAMTVIDDQGRPEPPPAAGETETVLGFLEFQRATFAWKCAGLDSEGLDTAVAASTMTLGGMLKHLALVEDWWFVQGLYGRPASQPWNAIDWDADPDWDWRTAADDSPDELRALWQDSVSRSRDLVAQAQSDGGFDRLSDRVWSDGRTPNLRWIVVHMIEEYARHNGHADLIRESLDGQTGE
jgi:hypothetical protein